VHMDVLAQRSGFDRATLSTQLLTLELDGLVERLPDGTYRRLG
jgi:predicted Rossmann fold nucleotide-binding protein DprA/Smf involved in DNA uptake